AVKGEILRWVVRQKLDGTRKNDLLIEIAAAIDLPYAEILARRILQLMTPHEMADASRRGARVELHTHRHHSPGERSAFEAEIVTNREIIRAATGREPIHFCYPSGRYDERFF